MNQTILPEILDSGENKSIAISVPDKYKITYLELKNHVDTASNLLNSFGTLNERAIIIVLGNNAEFIITFLAVTKTNAIAAPLNPEFTPEEFKFYLEDINPSLLITTEGHQVIHEAKNKNIPIATVSFKQNTFDLKFDGSPYQHKDNNKPNEKPLTLIDS